jgi:transcriptional regulator with GAF, ATPase, and Fis domain
MAVGTDRQSYHDATMQFQRALIAQALTQCQQGFGAAALQLGLTRHALRHQMIKLGMLAQDGVAADGSAADV